MTLVQSHARASTGLASGVQAVSQATSAFACTQAAYRFFHNPRITLPDLATPLLAHARTRVPQVCDNYLLVAHDWSQLMYPKHTGKKLRLSLSSKHAPKVTRRSPPWPSATGMGCPSRRWPWTCARPMACIARVRAGSSRRSRRWMNSIR